MAEDQHLHQSATCRVPATLSNHVVQAAASTSIGVGSNLLLVPLLLRRSETGLLSDVTRTCEILKFKSYLARLKKILVCSFSFFVALVRPAVKAVADVPLLLGWPWLGALLWRNVLRHALMLGYGWRAANMQGMLFICTVVL